MAHQPSSLLPAVKAVTRNLFRGVSSRPFRPFSSIPPVLPPFPSFSPPQSGPSNLAKGIKGVLLAAPVGGGALRPPGSKYTENALAAESLPLSSYFR